MTDRCVVSWYWLIVLISIASVVIARMATSGGLFKGKDEKVDHK